MGKWGTHAIAKSARKLVHAIQFKCGFTRVVVKCPNIAGLRLWRSQLDCGEVERHTEYCKYEQWDCGEGKAKYQNIDQKNGQNKRHATYHIVPQFHMVILN